MADDDYSDDLGSSGGGSDFGGALGALFQALNTTTPEAQEYSRKILKRDLDGTSDFGEAEALKKMETNAQTVRSALEGAKQRLLQQQMDPSQKWFAIAQGLGAPTRSGRFGETMGNLGGALSQYDQQAREFDTAKSNRLLDLETAMGGVDQDVIKAQLGLANLKRQTQGKMDVEALKTLGKSTNSSLQIPAKARQAVDRAYAKDYVDFIQGGAADAVKALTDLDQASNNLKKSIRAGKDNLTGPVVGSISKIPVVGKAIQDIAFPDSANTQELVEYTVQRSLRPILGAQFTEKEGERLISRVYNPRLDQKTNALRLDRLRQQLQRAYDEKMKAAKWFERYGTLSGFQGKTSWNVSDFEPEDEGPKTPTSKPAGKIRIKLTDMLPGETVGEAVKRLHPEYGIDFNDPIYEGLTHDEIIDANKPAKAEGGRVEEDTFEIELPDGSVVEAPSASAADAISKMKGKPKGKQKPLAFDVPTEGEDTEAQSDTGLSALRNRIDLGAGATAAAGTGIGALTAKYGLGAIHNVADLFPGHGVSGGERPVLEMMEGDQLSPEGIADRVARLRRLGVPATVMDEGGPGIEALTTNVLSRSSPGLPEALRDIRQRQAGSRGRVEDQVNKALVPDNYFDQEKKLRQQRAAEAKPLYQAAYDQFPSVKSEQLLKLLDTPSGKKAVENAIESMQDKPGATIGQADALGMVRRHSLEFLDQVKQELDDMIIKEEGSGMNYKATGKGKRLRALRDAFVDELDKATTVNGKSAYGEARGAWQEGSELLSALKTGREDFLKLDPSQLQPLTSNMNAAEKENLRTGVAQRLFEQIKNPTSNINVAQKIIGSPGMEERLSLLFDNPKQFEMFKAALQGEANLYNRGQSILRQGQAGRRSGAIASPTAVEKLADKAATPGITSPFKWVLGMLTRKQDIPDKALPEVLDLLRSGDSQSLEKFRQLQSKYGRTAQRALMKSRAGRTGAVVGAIAALTKLIHDQNSTPAAPPPEAKDSDEEAP